MSEKELKDYIIKRFLEIYNECDKDYEKFVLKIEELEKSGKIKSAWINRDNTKNIWTKSG